MTFLAHVYGRVEFDFERCNSLEQWPFINDLAENGAPFEVHYEMLQADSDIIFVLEPSICYYSYNRKSFALIDYEQYALNLIKTEQTQIDRWSLSYQFFIMASSTKNVDHNGSIAPLDFEMLANKLSTFIGQGDHKQCEDYANAHKTLCLEIMRADPNQDGKVILDNTLQEYLSTIFI
ncbi:unnamed protein product [Rotaria socialis]|uniref:Uncharacterized protein n=1 Tax=Rotaria socialis TaxID=392032 RepID=A0A820EY07_9BILA|nr:unnamed protein product [Rotaria socialis]CAF4500932.1 unnamed protein product [Rotaria socialis]